MLAGQRRWQEILCPLKHFMIAVEGGYNESLNAIKQMYSNGGM